ncbi:MAG TPA: nucleoside deaminase [Chitinophagaceae bacterium]|nr:nucleoside deaminase [Chitinophagaceae bacterium]
MHFTLDDEHFMQQALMEAKKALEREEVPVGAIIVQDGLIIGRGSNQVEQLNDSTAHAEILALTSAFNYLDSKYLPQATIYVTIEPCLMCAGALYWSQVKRIIYGAPDEKNGFHRVTGTHWPFHPKATVLPGLCEAECLSLIKGFFNMKRGNREY